MSPSLPAWSQWLAAVVAATVLVVTAKPALAEWRRRGENATVQVLVLGTLALAAMRWFNTAALQGVMLHFLGATIATLVFGTATACWVMALVSLGGVLQGAAWQGWAPDFLVTGALPVAVTALASWTARNWAPRNIFTYVMLNAFGGGALAMASSMLTKALVAWWAGARTVAAYLAATPLLMFAEAFFAGTVMVLVVVYRPHWCRDFDDKAYLWPQQRM
ncbi:MAG TPA: energy-coupling factor ABC transporter permease [Luteimonas sp.]|nr:energy-coupling factor ABC transporter permease [Luteimonas sp.]HRP73499.1 energy-coupling factor ABC transporter permease [Luteimonas sp.]